MVHRTHLSLPFSDKMDKPANELDEASQQLAAAIEQARNVMFSAKGLTTVANEDSFDPQSAREELSKLKQQIETSRKAAQKRQAGLERQKAEVTQQRDEALELVADLRIRLDRAVKEMSITTQSQNEVPQLQAKILQLEAENRTLKERIGCMESAALGSTADERVKALATNIGELSAEALRREEAAATLEGVVNKLRMESRDHAAAIEEAATKYAALQEENHALLDRLESQQVELATARLTISQQEENLAASERRRSSAELEHAASAASSAAQIGALTATIEQLKNREQQLNARQAEALQHIADLNTQIKGHVESEATLEKAHAQLARAHERSKALCSAMLSHKCSMDSGRCTLSKMASWVQERREKRKDGEAALLQQANTKLNQICESRVSELDAAREEISKLDCALQRERNERNALSETCSGLAEKCNVLDSKLVEAQDQYRGMEGERLSLCRALERTEKLFGDERLVTVERINSESLARQELIEALLDSFRQFMTATASACHGEKNSQLNCAISPRRSTSTTAAQTEQDTLRNEADMQLHEAQQALGRASETISVLESQVTGLRQDKQRLESKCIKFESAGAMLGQDSLCGALKQVLSDMGSLGGHSTPSSEILGNCVHRIEEACKKQSLLCAESEAAFVAFQGQRACEVEALKLLIPQLESAHQAELSAVRSQMESRPEPAQDEKRRSVSLPTVVAALLRSTLSAHAVRVFAGWRVWVQRRVNLKLVEKATRSFKELEEKRHTLSNIAKEALQRNHELQTALRDQSRSGRKSGGRSCLADVSTQSEAFDLVLAVPTAVSPGNESKSPTHVIRAAHDQINALSSQLRSYISREKSLERRNSQLEQLCADAHEECAKLKKNFQKFKAENCRGDAETFLNQTRPQLVKGLVELGRLLQKSIDVSSWAECESALSTLRHIIQTCLSDVEKYHMGIGLRDSNLPTRPLVR